MAIRNIVTQGDEVLTKKCRVVTDFNERLHTLIDDMIDTLNEADGVGLAAPQVGVLRRVCIILNKNDEVIELINPEVIKEEGEQDGIEGCLSVPGKYAQIKRPNIVRVKAQNRFGEPFEIEDDGITARCFLHEIEHLDGHLFVEKADHLMSEEELQELIDQQREENQEED